MQAQNMTAPANPVLRESIASWTNGRVPSQPGNIRISVEIKENVSMTGKSFIANADQGSKAKHARSMLKDVPRSRVKTTPNV